MPSAKDGPAAIQRDIEATRARLAQTVAAMAGKADMRQQGRRKLESARQEASARRGTLAAVAALLAVAMLALLVVRRKRSCPQED